MQTSVGGELFWPISLVAATTGFQISIKYAIQILAAFVHPGKPMWVAQSYQLPHSNLSVGETVFSAVMYVNLYGNSTAYQTLAMLQGTVSILLLI